MVARYATAGALQRLRPQLFACYRSALLPDSNGHKPATELFSIWHLDAGKVCVQEGHDSLEAAAGDTVLLPPGRPREQHFSEDTRLLSCRFSICWPDGRPLCVDGLPLVLRGDNALLDPCIELATYMRDLPVLRYGPFDRCRLRFDQYISSHRRFLAVIEAWLAVLDDHDCTCHFAARHDPRVERAMSLLEQQGDLAQVDYRTLCEATALGRAQLDRLFRQEFGRSPTALLNQRRMQLACHRLSAAGTTVAGVADELQFCDAAHFRRWFRRHHRMGPDEYRRHCG